MDVTKSFVIQLVRGEPLQATWDELDRLVATLGDIEVRSISDTIHANEPPASPYNAEYGYKLFPGEPAVVRIVVFRRLNS